MLIIYYKFLLYIKYFLFLVLFTNVSFSVAEELVIKKINVTGEKRLSESFILNLNGREEEALLVTERSLRGSRFLFDEDLFINDIKIRTEQGINTSNAQIAAVGASPNRASSLKLIKKSKE